MKLVKIFIFVLGIFIIGSSGQSTREVPLPGTANVESQPVEDQVRGNSTYAAGPSFDQRQTALRKLNDQVGIRNIPIINEKLSAYNEQLQRTKKILMPSASYYIEFAKFLKDKKSGLARIHLDSKCTNLFTAMVVSADELERCGNVVPILGGGSFYSFRFKTNVIGVDNFDVHFVDKKFEVSNKNVQGIVSEVGIKNLEELNSNSKAVKFINDLVMPTRSAEIQQQNEVLSKGLVVDGLTYSNSTQVLLGHSYVLRSVADGSRGDKDWKKQLDVTLVFKIVGREDDGSVIVLWKRLKK